VFSVITENTKGASLKTTLEGFRGGHSNFLLGNKDDEKVMELMSKAMRNSQPNRRDSGRRCYSFGGYGHVEATCPFRRRYEWSLPFSVLASCKQRLWV